MHTKNLRYDRGRKIKYTTYDDLNDLTSSLMKSDIARAMRSEDYSWAGGSFEDNILRSKNGVQEYATKAEKYIDQFSNAAIEDYALKVEHNLIQGMLDVGAWAAGEPACLIGATVAPTDKAPIAVTVDQWIWCGIQPSVIEMRGIAVMALVQALSIFRPVALYIVLANRHLPTGTDAVQVVPAPTAPMDTSRAGYMLAGPSFVRQGMMRMLFHIANSRAPCGIPALSAGHSWQTDSLPKWLAPLLDVKEENIIHLPMMKDPGPFETPDSAQQWVTDTVAKYADN